MRSFRSAGAGAGLSLVLAAGVWCAAPRAEAVVLNVEVSAVRISVGQTYTVTATVAPSDNPLPVTFTDNGSEIAQVMATGPTVSIDWSPSTAGTHDLAASQPDAGARYVTVTVTE